MDFVEDKKYLTIANNTITELTTQLITITISLKTYL